MSTIKISDTKDKSKMKETKRYPIKVDTKINQKKDKNIEVEKDKILEKRDSGICMDENNPMDNSLPISMEEVRDELVNMKIENSNMKAALINNNILIGMREDLQIMSMWFKIINQDNLSNYMEGNQFAIMEYNDHVMVHPNKWHNEKYENLMNFKCNCETCLVNSIMGKIKRINGVTKTHKAFLLSRNVKFEMMYDDKKYFYTNKVNIDGVKEIELTNKQDINDKIKLTFSIDKSSKNKENSFDFSAKKVFLMTYGGTEWMVTLSSVILAVAMRSLRNSQVTILSKTFIKGLILKESCFKDVINKMMKYSFLVRNVFCWADLTFEEEVILLSNLSENIIHIYLDQGLAFSINNHISEKEFKNSKSVKLKELAYPFSRNWMFFASKNDELQDQFDLLGVDHNSEAYSEVDWVSEPEEEKTKEDSIENKTKINDKEVVSNFEKNYFPDNERIEEMKKEKKSSRLYLLMDNTLVEEATDFQKSLMLERMRDKGYSNKMLEAMTNSKLANIMWRVDNLNSHYIFLFNLTSAQFKAVMYFSGDKINYPTLVFESPISTWVQMSKSLMKMFYEKFKTDLMLTMENLESNFNFFLNSMLDISDMNSNLMYYLEVNFRQRIWNLLILNMYSREEKFEDISLRAKNYNKVNNYHDQILKIIYKERFNLIEEVKKDDKNSIKRFQPEALTNKDLKDCTWIEDMNNEMFLESLEYEENKIKKMINSFN